jgi:hypothetical protein
MIGRDAGTPIETAGRGEFGLKKGEIMPVRSAEIPHCRELFARHRRSESSDWRKFYD